MTHGGAIATVLSEAIEWVVEVEDGSESAVGETGSTEVKKLGLTYLKPTYASSFHYVAVKVGEPVKEAQEQANGLGRDKDLSERVQKSSLGGSVAEVIKGERNVEVEASLHDMDGKVTVKARAVVGVGG